MCGFVGFTKEDSQKELNKMLERIVHRGPDSKGVFQTKEINFGFRRLSIIDVGENGSQPMFNEDKTVVLVFNGEIYNYLEIKKELVLKGHIFKSETDSEVLVHGYEEYGVEVIKRLRGMFAFALWDTKIKQLFLARDPFGIKPLYYTNNTKNGCMIFGSEIKSFLDNTNFIKELNNDALKPYLSFQYSALDETFFKGVFKLRPGHYLIYKNEKLEISKYYDIVFDEKKDTLDNYVQKIKETMEESVRYHKISDVKVGSFLSGGIDSSYITALLKPDNTFSVGFENENQKFNETTMAEELSKILKIHNHKKIVTKDEFFNILPTVQYHMDEPHSNLSAVPLYFLAKLAREHVTVVLSGEGADELFGGYEWYYTSNTMKKYHRIPFFIRYVIRKFSFIIPNYKIKDFLVRGGKSVEELFIGQAFIMDDNKANSLLKEKYKREDSVFDISRKFYNDVKGKDDETKKQYLDIKQWLPNDILLKADKMSMAHSIELRVPFLDKEVMSLAGKLPTSLRVNEHQSKYALRTAANQVIPSEWANRQKAGFMVPFREFIKEEKYFNIIKKEFETDYVNEFFDKKAIINLLEDHFSGVSQNARMIYTIYTFLIWYKEFFIKR